MRAYLSLAGLAAALVGWLIAGRDGATETPPEPVLRLAEAAPVPELRQEAAVPAPDPVPETRRPVRIVYPAPYETR